MISILIQLWNKHGPPASALEQCSAETASEPTAGGSCASGHNLELGPVLRWGLDDDDTVPY